jgi:hypothetical protein
MRLSKQVPPAPRKVGSLPGELRPEHAPWNHDHRPALRTAELLYADQLCLDGECLEQLS